MLNSKLAALCALGASLSACGTTAVPEAKMTTAKTSVSAAEAVRAEDEPQAQLHLKMAQDAITAAEKQIAENQNEEAALNLERALADAELASELTNEAEMQRSSEAAVARLEALQQEINGQGN
jgi:hypothetical protein